MVELKNGSKLQNKKYEIIKVLGSGNFGITYLATTKVAVNGQLGQMKATVNVAIKEFYMKDLNNRTSDGITVEGTQNTMVKNYRQKFRKEAENLAKLHHPNIVKVIEVFDENNTTYYVMEYIEGGSLDDYIKQKGHLSEDEALRCTVEIGNALSYMHENRMIHLDLKPKNIMRNQNGTLYLIDFGLSKQYDENGEPESSTSIGLGTPGYAPLEQSNYKQDGTLPVTLDVYALGASLFKMLTGKTPPESSILLNEGFPLASLKQAGVSASTISIVEKAMSPMKKERYQTVSSLSEAISNLSDDNEQTNYQGEEVTEYNSLGTKDVDEVKENTAETPQKPPIGKSKVRKSVGCIVKGVVFFCIGIVLLLLSVSISNMPIEIRENIGYYSEASDSLDRNWNIGIFGLMISIIFFLGYMIVKKKILAWTCITGCVLSLAYIFVFLHSETKVYRGVADSINIGDYKEVDLGLPSGTIWADRNLGAISPTSDGYHYAFSIDSLRRGYDIIGIDKIEQGESIVGTEEDMAHIKLGNGWQLPSNEQVKELINSCSFYLDLRGYKVVGPNGNTLFLPFTRDEGSTCLYMAGNKGSELHIFPESAKSKDLIGKGVGGIFLHESNPSANSIRPVKKQ